MAAMAEDHPTIAGNPIHLLGNLHIKPINVVMTSLKKHVYTLQLLTMARMTRMTIQCLKQNVEAETVVYYPLAIQHKYESPICR